VARPSSGGPEVRVDRWGPSVSRAQREGEGGVAGGVFLWGRWQFGGAPPARGSAGPAVRPRPSGKRGSGWLERKKKNGPRLGRKAGWAGSDGEKIIFRIKFDF
jgi:hypothetical protein